MIKLVDIVTEVVEEHTLQEDWRKFALGAAMTAATMLNPANVSAQKHGSSQDKPAISQSATQKATKIKEDGVIDKATFHYTFGKSFIQDYYKNKDLRSQIKKETGLTLKQLMEWEDLISYLDSENITPERSKAKGIEYTKYALEQGVEATSGSLWVKTPEDVKKVQKAMNIAIKFG